MRFGKFIFSFFFLLLVFPSYAQKTARAIVDESSKKNSISESVIYLKNAVSKLQDGSEKRSATVFLAGVLEQLGRFLEAQEFYAAAADMDFDDASGMPKKSAEQLFIDAVRCALSLGDSATADSFLRGNLRSPKNSKIAAYAKLYSQWSVLCKAQTAAETRGAIAALKSYSSEKSMKIVRPSILLTLWHITGESEWAAKLKSDFPNSPESAIARGLVQQLPTPFWYFVPRSGADVPETTVAEGGAIVRSSEDTSGQKAVKEQLGLFRDEKNAKRLAEKLKASGFSAKIEEEMRKDGSKYYLVYVPENKSGTMGELLRAAGFECYPLFE